MCATRWVVPPHGRFPGTLGARLCGAWCFPSLCQHDNLWGESWESPLAGFAARLSRASPGMVLSWGGGYHKLALCEGGLLDWGGSVLFLSVGFLPPPPSHFSPPHFCRSGTSHLFVPLTERCLEAERSLRSAHR